MKLPIKRRQALSSTVVDKPLSYEDQRALRLKKDRARYKKRQRQDLYANFGAGGIIAGGVVGLIVGFALLGTLPVWLGWNLGVVGISHALHGHIQHISFWVALGASLGIGVISRIFHRDGGVKVNLKQ